MAEKARGGGGRVSRAGPAPFWSTALLTIALGALGLAVPTDAAAQIAVAIVVHPETEVENLTLEELKSIFRGDRQFWDDGRRVTLLVRAPVAAERQMILDRIYEMDENQFREYWIGKMFRAEVAAGPKLVYSADMARELVTVIPGAITFVPVSDVSSETKVVRINGLLPSDEGYPLR